MKRLGKWLKKINRVIAELRVIVTNDNSFCYFPLSNWTLRDMEIIIRLYFFNIIVRIDILSTSCEIGLKWISHNPLLS